MKTICARCLHPVLPSLTHCPYCASKRMTKQCPTCRHPMEVVPDPIAPSGKDHICHYCLIESAKRKDN